MRCYVQGDMKDTSQMRHSQKLSNIARSYDIEKNEASSTCADGAAAALRCEILKTKDLQNVLLNTIETLASDSLVIQDPVEKMEPWVPATKAAAGAGAAALPP